MNQQHSLQSDCYVYAVPVAVRHYLAHTVDGHSIRSLARASACHPSTVLRQVRRFESRRDDPLIDAALKALLPATTGPSRPANKGTDDMKIEASHRSGWLNEAQNHARIDREALQVLRRLCEHGAVLAVARDMDSAVVVREDRSGASLRTAVVEREIAQAMALQGWISCASPEARIARYFITTSGREALRRLTAAEENRAQGFRAEPSHDKRNASHQWDLSDDFGTGSRYMVTESPLIGLARRKDKDGQPFLNKDQVTAGERMRQDFELSQVGPKVTEDWRAALMQGLDSQPKATRQARLRLIAAMDDLGPGLSDVVLQCCCFLEGLEVTEKKMGWSSRSGKIVLRIALQRLMRHYEETQGKYAPMIG
jgi:DNA-binding MarR family transcriptional regulator